MAIYTLAQSVRGLVRLAVVATVLALVAITGVAQTVRADEPARAGAAGAQASAAVPMADTVVLSLAPAVRLSSSCMVKAVVSYKGLYLLPNYEVTFDVVSGPNAGLTVKGVSDQNGAVLATLPRPMSGSQPNVIRATLHSYQIFLSNTVGCASAAAATAAAVAVIGPACPPSPQPC
jgi:hypothetical protein